MSEAGERSVNYLCQRRYVFNSRVRLLASWFVSKIRQKLLNGFPRHLDK